MQTDNFLGTNCVAATADARYADAGGDGDGSEAAAVAAAGDRSCCDPCAAVMMRIIYPYCVY